MDEYHRPVVSHGVDRIQQGEDVKIIGGRNMELPEIPTGEKLVLVYPKIQTLMSGVHAATLTPDNDEFKITLHYTDQTAEERTCTRAEWIGFDNLFTLVRYVQDGRK